MATGPEGARTVEGPGTEFVGGGAETVGGDGTAEGRQRHEDAGRKRNSSDVRRREWHIAAGNGTRRDRDNVNVNYGVAGWYRIYAYITRW